MVVQPAPLKLYLHDGVLRPEKRKSGQRASYPRERKGAHSKKMWQDPVWRAKQIAERHARFAREKAEGTSKRLHSAAVYLKDGTRHPPLPGCTRKQTRWFWRQARFEATLTMKKLIKAGVVNEDEVSANNALHYALSVMKAPVDQKLGLAAARIVLDFTKSKPVVKSEVSISKAEEWLEAVTADNEQNAESPHEEDAGDAQASA